MTKNTDLLQNKYKIYDSLVNSNSIEEIINTAQDYFNNPIFILDTSFKILYKSPLCSCEKTYIEQINDDEYLKLNVIELMKKEKCIDNLYKSNKSFYHIAEEKYIFCSILIDDHITSYIAILEKHSKFKDENLEIANTLSKVLSIKMQNCNLFLSHSGLSEEYILAELLSPSENNMYTITSRLHISNFKTLKYNFVLTISYKIIYKDYRNSFALNNIISSIKSIIPNTIVCYYKEHIVFLTSNDNFNKKNVIDFSKLQYYLKLNNLVCGISMPFIDLKYIKDYFNQSIYSITNKTYNFEYSYIHTFDNIIIDYLFYHHRKSNIKINLNSLINPHILILQEYDKQSNSEYILTLKTYLKCNRNSNEAAKELNIHKSTFFYRYHKIEELLDIKLNDNDLLFNFELCFKLLNNL